MSKVQHRVMSIRENTTIVHMMIHSLKRFDVVFAKSTFILTQDILNKFVSDVRLAG